MNNQFKILITILMMFLGTINVNAQKACCAGAAKANCTSNNKTGEKACCSKTSKETTSGCTPSNCRGAKTKFNEAKVISTLRLDLVALKEKLEFYKKHQFSNEAITVHGIVGETDDESLDIISKHVSVIELEIYTYVKKQVPELKTTKNKASLVKQLQEKIVELNQLL